ncbi:ORF16 [Ranid herpesvirus 1]|uniref:ORF16 n=1 Tax=Ranid herpesvirus 1 TaxID=85655 RepID=Q14VU2_9VIRU|nr:ORF16 [Ranid herpesvirus 1]ABG25798.1 ORF16 [Ranid herpesvirus 1]
MHPSSIFVFICCLLPCCTAYKCRMLMWRVEPFDQLILTCATIGGRMLTFTAQHSSFCPAITQKIGFIWFKQEGVRCVIEVLETDSTQPPKPHKHNIWITAIPSTQCHLTGWRVARRRKAGRVVKLHAAPPNLLRTIAAICVTLLVVTVTMFCSVSAVVLEQHTTPPAE